MKLINVKNKYNKEVFVKVATCNALKHTIQRSSGMQFVSDKIASDFLLYNILSEIEVT